MAENISPAAFIANFRGGGIRTNLFKVVITFPPEVGGQTAAQKISYTCKSAIIPGSRMGQATVFYQGRPIPLAGDRQLRTWNHSILLDDLDTYDAFIKWHGNMNGEQSNTATAGWTNPARYMATAEIMLLNKEGNAIRTFKMEYCFPTEIADVNLDWSQQDQIAELPVTMVGVFLNAEGAR